MAHTACEVVSCLLQKINLLLLQVTDAFLEKDLIQTLHEEFSFLKPFLLEFEAHELPALRVFAARIRNLASHARVIVDSYLFILHTSSHAAETVQIQHSIEPTLTEVMEKIELITLQIASGTQVNQKIAFVTQVNKKIIRSVAPNRVNLKKASESQKFFENEKMKIMEQLLEPSRHLRCITLVGMGGIGKTTLAENVYCDDSLKLLFHVRGFVSVSQGYNKQKMLLGLLKSLSQVVDRNSSADDLREQLRKCLKGKRYLIILDDLWYTEAWDDIRLSFPDDENQSRIMITTRLGDVASYASPHNPPHEMPFLNADQSFSLLCEMIFVNDECPDELVDVGKQLAENCMGLPLGIAVVAGLLSHYNKRPWWRAVKRSVASLLASNSEQCLDILALSYNNLPDNLKSCFLYFGVFPHSFEIPAWRLMLLWIAEGFVKPVEGKALEDVAEEQLEDLARRNLILVKKRKYNGQIKTCGVHDLFRDLCLKVADEEKFLQLINWSDGIHPTKPFVQRRISIHSGILEYFNSEPFAAAHSDSRRYIFSKPYIADTRSILSFDSLDCRFLKHRQQQGPIQDLFSILVKFLLIRVLDLKSVHFQNFPKQVVQLLLLRYLSLSLWSTEIPESVSNLHRLETLIIDCYSTNATTLPRGIWRLTKLRHLYLRQGGSLPSPRSSRINPETLGRLQTLFMSSQGFTSRREFFECTPNLKKLGIISAVRSPEVKCISFQNLNHLHRLESLKWIHKAAAPASPDPVDVSSRLFLSSWEMFPANLKKISLCGSRLPWKEMGIIGKLPYLEVLKLKKEAFQGPEWEPNDEEFKCLKYLVLNEMHLRHWKASSSHFPALVRLVFRRCSFLEEIPLEIGEIATLEIIELHDSSRNSAISAEEIQQEQLNMGNDGLKIFINTSSPAVASA